MFLRPRFKLQMADFQSPNGSLRCGPRTHKQCERSDDAAHVYLPNDQAPKVGQIFRNPDLAASLKLIAANGRDAFYRGEIARKILETSKRHEGVMTPEDLAGFSSEWIEPISTTYRGWKVYELPPNGQGVAALEMLNIMETFPFQPPPANATPEQQQFALNQTSRFARDDRSEKIGVRRSAKIYRRSGAQSRSAEPLRIRCSAKITPRIARN